MQHEHQLAPHDNVPTRPGATDPVCGMDVDRESVLTLEHDGTAYHCWGAEQHRKGLP